MFHRSLKYHESRLVETPTLRSKDSFYLQIAAIVDFRAVDQLVAVVRNVNYHIPSTWPIQIFHGKDNEHFIRNSTLAPLICNNKIILTLMNETYDKSRTSELLTNPNFWRSIRGEKILFFQIDSIMCSNSPHRVTDYLQYDFVGAPWSDGILPATFDEQDEVGNGGFSIRTRSKVLALLVLVKYAGKDARGCVLRSECAPSEWIDTVDFGDTVSFVPYNYARRHQVNINCDPVTNKLSKVMLW